MANRQYVDISKISDSPRIITNLLTSYRLSYILPRVTFVLVVNA